MNVGENNPTPKPGPRPTPMPVATPAPAARMAADTLVRSAEPQDNPLDGSAPRVAYDAVASVAGAADGARGIAPGADAIRTAAEAGKLGRFGSLGTTVAGWLDGLVRLGGRATEAVSWLGWLGSGLAKAAPLLGVGVAVLDVGKAAIEDDPRKKRRAEGMAVLSGISGIAGLLAWGAAAGATAFGVALAPLAVPCMVVGVAATVLGVADQFLLDGKVARAIGGLFG